MKSLRSMLNKVWMAGFILASCSMAYEPASDILDDIAALIRAGNVRELSKHLDTNVEITIADREANYSKAQAEQVLRDFFVKNPVKTFEIIHKGASKDGARYVIGTLSTTHKTAFRTMYYVRQKEGGHFIQEIRFEHQ